MNGLTRYIKPLGYIVALLLLGAGAFALWRARDDGGTYRVTAYFEKAIGLFDASDVDILGVPVGQVINIEPKGRRVEVVMEIDDRYKLPADARAQIVPISVIADRYVQLFPVYEGGPTLRDGAVIPVSRTQIPAELDDVFKQLKKLLDAIQPGKNGQPGALGELVVQLNRTLEGSEEDLKGTLIQASELTHTLSRAQDDLSGLLINLEDFFSTLSTRAGSYGTLNRNLVLVLTALAESRNDLEGTVENLGGLTTEVASLVREHRSRLGRDLELATTILNTVLEHRDSVSESLAWLPVVAEGLTRAYHPPPIDAVDVRDNLQAKLKCKDFEELPLPDPIKDELVKLCKQETGEPDREAPALTPTRIGEDVAAPVVGALNCDKAVRKVNRQVDRISKTGLPQAAKDEVVRPLKKQLRQLKKRCKQIVRKLEEHGLLDGLLDELPEVGDIPELERPAQDAGVLTGNAAGAGFVPSGPSTSSAERAGGWLRGFLDFLGWSR